MSNITDIKALLAALPPDTVTANDAAIIMAVSACRRACASAEPSMFTPYIKARLQAQVQAALAQALRERGVESEAGILNSLPLQAATYGTLVLDLRRRLDLFANAAKQAMLRAGATGAPVDGAHFRSYLLPVFNEICSVHDALKARPAPALDDTALARIAGMSARRHELSVAAARWYEGDFPLPTRAAGLHKNGVLLGWIGDTEAVSSAIMLYIRGLKANAGHESKPA